MIPAYVPALSLAGFSARTPMPPSDVALLESKQPGYLARQCRIAQQEVYGQLRKRYLVDTLGQSMGPPSGSGTSPPPLTFNGIPSRGDLEIVIQITTGGPLGVALFSWSLDAGGTWVATNVATGALVPLPGTGVSLVCPPGPWTFDPSNLYTAATPVDEVVLGWIEAIVTPRAYARRGANMADPQLVAIVDRATTAAKNVADAANSKDGLWDLPLNVDTGGSGITQGSPLGCSEQSPYVWADYQAEAGRAEDAGRGGVLGE